LSVHFPTQEISLKTSPILVLAFAVVMAGAAPARAQQEPLSQKVFVNYTLSARQGAGELSVSSPFQANGGTGTVAIDDDIAGGPMHDVSIAFKPWKYFAIGGGYSVINSHDFDQYVLTYPSPVAGFQPLTVRAITPALDHKEEFLSVNLLWMKPITPKYNVTLSAGPVFYTVHQEVPVSSNIIGSNSFGLNEETQKEDGVGFHAAMDLDYMFTKIAGGGLQMRYIHGSVDFPNTSESMSVGGLQIGAGVRIRF
jgi:hypothetical protein